MAKDFVSSLLHFDWFLPQTIFSHPRFCSAGSERGFCHGPKETEGEQVSNLSVDFTQGACPRGGTLASYWNPAGRRKQTEGRGTRKQWRQPSIWRGFTPSVCWFGLLLFVFLEKRREVTSWGTGFLEWRLSPAVVMIWFIFCCFFLLLLVSKEKRWPCFLCCYGQKRARITVLISPSTSLPFYIHAFFTRLL